MCGQFFRSLLLCVHRLRRASDLLRHLTRLKKIYAYGQVLQQSVPLCTNKLYKCALFYHLFLPLLQLLFSIRRMYGQFFRSLLLCVHKLLHASDLLRHLTRLKKIYAYGQVLQQSVPLCTNKLYKCALFYHLFLPLLQLLFSIHRMCGQFFRSLLLCVHRLRRANGLFHHLSTLLKNCVHDCPTLPDILQTQMTSPLPKLRQAI